jgi:hypothetical protein
MFKEMRIIATDISPVSRNDISTSIFAPKIFLIA